MPLVKKNQNKAVTKENNDSHATLEEQKKKDMTFAGNGLNDESVDGLTTLPLTANDNAELTSLTQKLDRQAAQNQAKHMQKSINTYGLTKPVCEECLEGYDNVAELVCSKIWNAVVEHKWYAFFTKTVDGIRVANQEKLQNVANTATRHSYNFLVEQYGYGSLDVATNLSVLALADTILLGDNSGSMTYTDASKLGDLVISRWEYLKDVSKDDGFISSIFDDDGYEIVLMSPDRGLTKICQQIMHNEKNIWVLKDPKNPDSWATMHDDFSGFTGVTSMEQCEMIYNAVGPNFSTPTADAIARIYMRSVKSQATSGTLAKPVIIKLYTDGHPNLGQNVKEMIRKIKLEMRDTIYGDHAVLFQIVQTGKDKSVNDWFEELDTDEVKDSLGRPVEPNNGIGDIVDCVSDYEIELEQILKNNPGATWFDVAFYKMKCRVGVMIGALDKTDETTVESVTSIFGGMMAKAKALI